MSLFTFDEIVPKIGKAATAQSALGAKATGKARAIEPNRHQAIGECLGQLEPEQFIWVPSLGNWSAHHVVEYLAEQVGACEFWFMSWAISEGPIRRLLSNEHLRVMGAVLSDRVKTECPKAFQLLSANLETIALRKNHSKGFVLKGKKSSVSVTMTANFTANRRIECYAISTHQNVIEAHLMLIKQVINGNDGEAD